MIFSHQKYAKEVITYVDKRASLELELARGLSKLAQPMRQALRDETIQSISESVPQ